MAVLLFFSLMYQSIINANNQKKRKERENYTTSEP